jgi:hypothetical protein
VVHDHTLAVEKFDSMIKLPNVTGLRFLLSFVNWDILAIW